MSLSSVLHTVGRLCLVYAGLLLLPLVLVGLEGDLGTGAAWPFLMSAGVAAVAGLGLGFLCEMDREAFDFEEGFAVVTFSWVAFSLLGAMPYVISGAVPDIVDALFEASSGLTTTGASVLPDPAALGRPLLFWRALTHWVGGMGIVVLSIAILPALGAGGSFLYGAESTGPGHDRPLGRIKDVAKMLWGVYVGLTLLEVVALLVAGMDLFDAVCHSFATVATGGFGTRSDSLASFGPAVQWVVTVFMVLAGLNYLMLLGLFRGRPGDLLRNTEARLWLGLLVVATVVGVLVLHADRGAPDGLEPLVRGVALSVVSVSSTTGFAGEDFGLWPVPLQVLVLLLMVGGACTGSTSGSAKMGRHIMWAKAAWRELQRLLRPTAVFVVKVGGRTVDDMVVTRSVAFLLFYLGSVAAGTLVLTFLGLGGLEGFTSMITCLSGVGPGLGEVGPASNFAAVGDGAKCVLMGAMLLGRLEFFAILALLSPLAWRR